MSETSIRAYASERSFSDATLERWLRQEEADRAALLALAVRLRLGENQLRDVLNALEDIAARSGRSLRAVLAEETIAAVLGGDRGRNDAIHALKQALRLLRYPRLSAVAAELNALVRGLHLPRGVRVAFPENLEGEEVTITLQAKSAEQLRSHVRALAAVAERDEVETMFRLLAGVE